MAEERTLVMLEKMSTDFMSIFLDEPTADITFIVGNEKIKMPAHKSILLARSTYFRNFFASDDNRNLKEFPAQDENTVVFRLVLKYIYGGRLDIVDLSEEQNLELLILALKYGLTELEIPITDHLVSIVNPENFCKVFEITYRNSLMKLFDFCLDYADRNAKDIFGLSHFSLLPLDLALILVSRETLRLPEIDLFKAVSLWCKANYGVDAGVLLSEIRLHRICHDDLLHIIWPSKFFPEDKILRAISERPVVDKLKNVDRMVMDTNFAATDFGVAITAGAASDKYFDKPPDAILASHQMEENAQGIIIKLGSTFTVNAIRMQLPDTINETSSYYVEVSTDEKQWTRIIDYTTYFCSGWQQLFFQPQSVRYIRICGTRATQGNEFRLLNFQISYISLPLAVENGVIVPTANVALLDLGARVVEGNTSYMLNGKFSNADRNTFHKVGAGAIRVRFPQPYILNSMRYYLADYDHRTYSYFVDVSTDGLSWTCVLDKRNEACRNWQNFEFAKQAVSFVRFTGTACSTAPNFRIVHLECPASNTV